MYGDNILLIPPFKIIYNSMGTNEMFILANLIWLIKISNNIRIVL